MFSSYQIYNNEWPLNLIANFWKCQTIFFFILIVLSLASLHVTVFYYLIKNQTISYIVPNIQLKLAFLRFTILSYNAHLSIYQVQETRKKFEVTSGYLLQTKLCVIWHCRRQLPVKKPCKPALIKPSKEKKTARKHQQYVANDLFIHFKRDIDKFEITVCVFFGWKKYILHFDRQEIKTIV